MLRSWSEVRRILEREVLPAWRHQRVVDIRRRDIRELVEKKARTSPIQANRVLERISAMFTFAVDQDWIESNPAWRIKTPGEERSRDRVLTRAELRELWRALHETQARDSEGRSVPRLSETMNDMLRVMLLTAQRRGEVCTMRWRDVDLETGWWVIPAANSKNGDAHRVPLTPMALAILKRRAEQPYADDWYVFSNTPNTCVHDRAKNHAARTDATSARTAGTAHARRTRVRRKPSCFPDERRMMEGRRQEPVASVEYDPKYGRGLDRRCSGRRGGARGASTALVCRRPVCRCRGRAGQ